MSRIRCPHCRAEQEVEAPSPGTLGRQICPACRKPFLLKRPSEAPGSTQKLHKPAAPPPGGASSNSPAGAPPLPPRLGPYEVRGVLGSGGMGVVYRGWDDSLGRHVALKTLKPELARDGESRERFLREARAAAALSHPHVTQIYFIGEEDGLPFFAMEYLDGRSLEKLIRDEGKLPPQRAADLVRQAASGLKAAAARGIVHRDVKPSNLVLTSEGTLKVTDFGLAKLVVAEAGLTVAGEILGSPHYMSPEQASGQPADFRSDIYALGATFYELVTGRPPFEGPTAVSIILKHAREPVRNPRQLSPDLPYPMTALIQKMMAKRPEDRPQSYDLLLRDLDRMGSGPGAPGRPVQTPPSPPRSPQPGDAAASAAGNRSWVAAVVVIAALLAAWGILRQVHRAVPASAGVAGPAAAGPAGRGPASRESEILGSSSEISPPEARQRPFARRGGLALPPRLERFREAARANLQFVANSHEFTADGRLRVMGTVMNTGVGRATHIRIRVFLSAPSGEILDSADVTLSPPLLGRNQSGTFEAFFPDPRQRVSIRTELNWNS